MAFEYPPAQAPRTLKVPRRSSLRIRYGLPGYWASSRPDDVPFFSRLLAAMFALYAAARYRSLFVS
ncbi:MAG TPA: hypothetical protein VG894_04000 [Bauldia sp.]|nr:hypothetical protein [Bauldia sp.]